MGAAGPVGYQASNAIAPNGFSESDLGPNRTRVRATGNLENSRAELEKLAMARAAEIGAGQHLKYVHVDAVAENIACGGKKTVGPSLNQVNIRHKRTVDVDVTFAKEAADASWLNTKESFPLFQGELAALAPQAGASNAGLEEGRQKCGS
jgi:cytochrome c551/c552